jgi:hypothetical protein
MGVGGRRVGKSKVISDICNTLGESNIEKCLDIIREQYPFNYIKYEKGHIQSQN